jgi:hypothetical protein
MRQCRLGRRGVLSLRDGGRAVPAPGIGKVYGGQQKMFESAFDGQPG